MRKKHAFQIGAGAVAAVFLLLATAAPAQAGWFDWLKFWPIKPVSVPEQPTTVGAQENPVVNREAMPTTITSPSVESGTAGAQVQPAIPAQPAEVQRPQKIENEMGCPPGESPGINDQGQKSCIRPGPAMGTSQEGPTFNEENKQEEPPQRMIDPREVQQIIRETKDQQRELKRFLTMAKKLKGGAQFVEKIQELLTKVANYQQKVKAASGDALIEIVDEYRDAQIWDDINVLRAQIELPKRLTDVIKSLTRVERLIKQKTFLKLKDQGINLDKIKEDIGIMRAAAAKTQELLNAGNFEEAQETLQEVFDDSHPGEIEGILHMMREVTDMIRRIGNPEIREMVKEILQPVFDAVNEGDYREANMMLNELRGEIQRLFPQLYKLKSSSINVKLQQKLDALEGKIQEKLQKEEPVKPTE